MATSKYLIDVESPDNLARGLQITPLQQMMSASSGAVLTSLTMTPLDVIKIRLQSQTHAAMFTQGRWKYSGMFDAMLKIPRYEGMTALWSGLSPCLIMCVPSTVVYFTCNEQFRLLLGYRENVLTDKWKALVAGGSARVFAATLISPIEMVRTKMQSERLKYSQLFTATKETVKARGVLSLYTGLGATLLRDVPFSSLYWFGYETVKTLINFKTGNDKLGFFESFIAGATSGTVAAVITLPFDVIKTRRQIELGCNLDGKKKQVTSTWKLIHKISVEEGVRALFGGLTPRLLKVAPACATMISTYELCKEYFIKQNRLNRELYLLRSAHESTVTEWPPW